MGNKNIKLTKIGKGCCMVQQSKANTAQQEDVTMGGPLSM